MSKMRKALLVVLVLALAKKPLDMLLAAVLPDVSVAAAPQMMAAAAVSLLLLGVPSLLLQPWTSPRLVRADKQVVYYLAAAVGAVLIRAAMTPVDAAWRNWLEIPAEAIALPSDPAAVLMYVVALAVVPAVTEELFFRGSLLTGLLDGGSRAAAVMITTVTFALLHGSLANLPGLLVISLLLTLLMLRSGCAAVPVTAHFFYNISALIWRQTPAWLSLLSGVLLAVLLGALAVRQPTMAHPPMRRLDGLIAAAAVLLLAARYLL